MRTNLLVLSALYFISLASCSGINQKDPLTVTLANSTSTQISVEKISGAIDAGVVTIAPFSEIKVVGNRSGDITFIVSYKGTRYQGNSGYADDYSAYRISFSESAGNLVCQLTHKTDGVRSVSLAVLP